MAGGYGSQAEGMDWINERFARIESMLAAMNGANPAESIVVHGPDGITAYDPATGSRLQYARGELLFWDDYDANPDNYGRLFCDPGAAVNMLRMFPPFSDGDGLENSVTVQGRREGQDGNVWVFSDGSIRLTVQDPDANKQGLMWLKAGDIILDADRIMPYGLQTISSTANLVVDFPDGFPVLKLTTSSERYKQDIADAVINPDDVLTWRPRTWRDRNAVEEQGDDAPVHIGFIAEEINEVTPEFVVIDNEGRPDSLKYDRMVAGLVTLAQKQAEQIDDLTQRIEALEAT